MVLLRTHRYTTRAGVARYVTPDNFWESVVSCIAAVVCVITVIVHCPGRVSMEWASGGGMVPLAAWICLLECAGSEETSPCL
jgi:hypothetical protein